MRETTPYFIIIAASNRARCHFVKARLPAGNNLNFYIKVATKTYFSLPFQGQGNMKKFFRELILSFLLFGS